MSLCIGLLSATAHAADYYNMPAPALGNMEGGGSSSISGSGSSKGWSTTQGGSRTMAGITAADSVYHVYSDFFCRSSQSSYATPSSSSIEVEQGVTWTIFGKQGNNTTTLNNVILKEDSTLHYFNNGDAGICTLTGDFTVADGAVLQISGRYTGVDRGVTFSASVSGTGSIVFCRYDNDNSYQANQVTHTLSGDISAFTGDIVAYDHGNLHTLVLELANQTSLPGDPTAGTTSKVVVTNGATLKIDQDWTSPRNRVWDFGGGSNKPTVYVAAGKTVTVNGAVSGASGFTKTGAGTLILRGGLSGFAESDIVVSEGSVEVIDTDATLTIASSATEEVSNPIPAYGDHDGLSAGQTLSVSCGAAVVTNGTGTAVYSCAGWKLYDEEGTVKSSGLETSFTYTHPSPATYRKLEWQWDSTFSGTIATGPGGSVSTSGKVWYDGSTPVSVTATPNSGLSFIRWSGTLPEGIDPASPSVTFTPTKPFDMTAIFGEAHYSMSSTPDGDTVYIFNASGPFTLNKLATARLLVVGGGGGGGSTMGGGGGAGGVVEVAETTLAAGTYTITVGAGGARGSNRGVGGSGGNSSIAFGGTVLYEAIGGGGGGGWVATAGASGGSGGGGSNGGDGALGSPGQGFAGAKSGGSNTSASGGGGGAGHNGYAAANARAGNGGEGKSSDITGATVLYGGGGGAGGSSNGFDLFDYGLGGAGGGGDGSRSAVGNNGTDGLGGGGGGGGWIGSVYTDGGAGGSGVVIVRVQATPEDTLRVSCSSKENFSSPSPAYGLVTGLTAGETRAVSCGATSVTNAAGTIVHSCTGWKLYDEDDTLVSSGLETSFAYTHPSPAAYRRLEWQWDSIFSGTIAVGPGGSVSTSGTAWYNCDTPVTVTATPDSDLSFMRWIGTLPEGIDPASASVTFTPTAPFEMTAIFGKAHGHYAESFTTDGDIVYAFSASGSFTLNWPASARLLLVGGGGAGGNTMGGGGGGGGVVEVANASLAAGTYTITVGAGGALGSGQLGGGKGEDSDLSFGGTALYTAFGGGGGGGWAATAGSAGGSGGGGCNSGNGGIGTAGQGFAGANGGGNSASGGGGGAGHAGYAAAYSCAGNGGEGAPSDITGETVLYGGGGGGGGASAGNYGNYNYGFGGDGGGGDGGKSTAGTKGTDGLGGGGGGGGWTGSNQIGGGGGSGVVIIRVSATPPPDVLTMSSSAGENLSSPSPAYGSRTGVVAGQEIAVSCGATVATNAAGTIHYTCTGWKLYDADGNQLSSGPETSFTYTHPSPAAYRRLEWQWDLAFSGTIEAGPGGWVSTSGTTWYSGSASVSVTATPNSGMSFVRWVGTLPEGINATSASVSFTTTEPFEMTALFGKWSGQNLETFTQDGDIVYIYNVSGSFTLDWPASARILLVGGGGAGGRDCSGGGGAGGMLEVTNAMLVAGTYTITVGAGGQPVNNSSVTGGNGEDSALSLDGTALYTAFGGGGGGSWGHTSGASGGSGGGATSNGTGGSGVEGQGYAGGNAGNRAPAGGGGAGGAGSYGSNYNGPGTAGGPGRASDITGETIYYAGGGGGGGFNSAATLLNGGLGGGGNGARYVNVATRQATTLPDGRNEYEAECGVDGLGGGGGGANNYSGDYQGRPGGSGVVIIRISATPPENVLAVSSSAGEKLSSPSPAYGSLNGVSAGQEIAVSCGATVATNAAGTAEYTCTGWKLYDADGNQLSSGPETSFTYTHPSPADYRRLEWQWAVSSVKGTITAGSGGSVSPSGTAWYATDTPHTVTATPDAGRGLTRWTGTLPAGIDATAASVTFTPSAPFEMAAAFSNVFRVDHITATAADGTGASWSDTISLEGAFAAAAAGEQIWIKAGTYDLGSAATLSSAATIMVRGGFTGGAIDDARADGAVSILDGKSANTADPVMSFTATSGEVTLERVEFVKIKNHALTKTGGADITVSGCRFLHCNTSDSNIGRVALNFTGTASAKAVITNCVFEANRLSSGNYNQQQGYTTWFSTFSSVDISDSLFATNGLTFTTSTHPGGRESMRGAVIYSTAAPLKVTRCEFRGNIYTTHSYENSGGAIWLAGNATGHSFRNCLFAGNRGTSNNAPNGSGQAPGVIFVQLNDKAQTVAIENCTFAYNTGYPATGVSVAAGITVSKGTLTCRNSIFHGNVIYSTGSAAADINLKTANAAADIDWCIFDSLGAANVSAGLGTLTLGANNVTGDPMLGTSTEEFRTNGLSQSYSILPATVVDSTALYIKQGFYNAIGSYDFHLLSRAGRYRTTSWGVGNWVQDDVNSPAIDAGDTAADYSLEPAGWNGGRLNLGAYGNTLQASKTEPFAPAIASVSVDTTSDYSQPHFTTTLGGTGTYRADVYCCLGASSGGAGMNGWDIVVRNASGALIGDVVDACPYAYLDAGETYWYKIVMVCNGAVVDETAPAQVTIPAGATRPPWDGHGGDASKVIHVRHGATGRGDGSSWSDACEDIDAALALVTAERNEIWMAGGTGSGTPIILQTLSAVTLRGGFDATEDSATERAAGSRSDIDGEQVLETALAIRNQAGAPVVIERFRLHHARTRAVDKTGTGDLAFIDCDFASNCWKTATANAALYGYGVKAAGGSAATVAFTNCTFTGNTSHANDPGGNNCTRGAAVYLESLRAALFDNCVFSCNGVENRGADRDDCLGSVLYATGAPVVCTRTKFLGGLATSNGGSSGSVIYLTGAGGGSSFRNCAFVGNGATGYQTTSTPTSGFGLFTVNFGDANAAASFDNCTFAYNFTDNDRHPAGLEIAKGAVTVRNSVFYGNANRGTAGTSGKDILIVGNELVSTLDIDYTMLTADNAASISAAYPEALAVGGHMLYGDPAFVSTPDDFMATLNSGSGFTNSVANTSFKSREAAAALNVHLRGGEYSYTDEVTGEACVVPMPAGSALERSPAIDTGDPSAPVAGEAEPNGGVVNLGAYGGTPYATRSPVGSAEIASATVDQSSDGTQPHIAVTLGGSGMYSATVVTCMGATDCGSNLAGWDYVKTNSTSAINGDVVDAYPGNYFARGQSLRWRVFVIDANGNVATEAGSLTVTGTPAPFQGHGGGAGVVHVRPGAMGRGDGTSWQDAVGTFAEGEALMTAQRNEMWVATPSIERSDIAMSHEFLFSAALRGGFAGTEDSLGDRADGSMTLIDGFFDSTRNYCLEVANGTGVALEIDGFHFDRGYWRAFNKTGYGDILFRNCRMSRSAPERSCRGTSDARTMYFDGGNTAAVSFENCVFDGNIGTAEVNYYSVGLTGLGFVNLRSLQIDSCLFTSNGTAFASNLGREGFEASCLYVSGTPTTVENCRFIANHTINHSHVSSHVFISGASSGSTFRNCLFAANGSTIFGTSHNGGHAVYVNLSAAASKVAFENCTFAYNYSQAKTPSGLYVNTGTATVTNCIFHANVMASGSTYPADIYVKSGAACAMDYTLLGWTDTTHVSAAALPADTSHLVIGDPLFISPTSAFLATMNAAAYPVADVDKPKFNTAADRGVAAGFNYHLSGPIYVDENTGEPIRTKLKVLSPAVDAGDPASPYGNEPRPHGRRVNLGFYGNTPWATCPRMHSGTVLIMQ